MSGSLPSLTALDPAGSFAARHIGPRGDDTAEMLRVVGHPTLESLADACVPEGVRDRSPLALPPAADEAAVLAELRERAAENDVLTSMIGLGYYGTVTPSVIQRTVLENPAWYTAYTPYQPEISQGRLEALINFQTMVADLTGLDVAGASMLDEATAAAEAMTLVRRAGRAKPDAVFVVDADTLPQTLAVLETRAEPLGIALHVADLSEGWPTDLPEAGAFGVLLSYPGASGAVRDHRALAAAAHEAGASVVVAADLLALTLLEAPGSGAPTSPAAPPSASASPWATAARTPATCRSARGWPASCPAGWSASRSTPTGTSPTGSRCRPASSTSAARRRPATSAPPRCCSP